ncbi:MAG: glycosyltransferase [Planctomycetaceae bacterium]|nr:glycosyltransferase [Planctomycetaceae bacterium]
MMTTGWLVALLTALWTIPPVLALIAKQLRPNCNLRTDCPDVSVIVPARNEAAGIQTALRTILKSEGVRLQVIAVDDRSTDATGRLMDEVAAEDPRLQVIHIDSLPAGWLGKNHAMHIGARNATGEYLLFTDGDVVYEPLAICSAVRFLRENRLQHLCLLPRMIPGGVIENCVVAFFGLIFAVGVQLQLIRTRMPFSYAGVGAFNLIDAAFYRQIGGHQPIAMDVLDDVMLGRMVKSNGGRQDFYSAPELLSIRWQPSLWGIVTGLEKNAFASAGYSLPFILFLTVLFFGGMILPWVAVAVLPFHESAGFLVTILIWHGCYGVAAHLSRGGWWLAPLFPVAAGIMAFTYWRSTFITLRRGGVRWRDSFYSLSELRSMRYRGAPRSND